jgi:hypothetical protein
VTWWVGFLSSFSKTFKFAIKKHYAASRKTGGVMLGKTIHCSVAGVNFGNPVQHVTGDGGVSRPVASA